MQHITEIIVSIIGAIASAGGIAGIVGYRTHKKHQSYKTDIDIKVAKLEEKVKGMDGNIVEIKKDIRYIRELLDKNK